MTSQLEGTHHHAKSGKLYTYKVDYGVNGGDIDWRAEVFQAEEPRFRHSGRISTNTPAAAAIAEQAVRDAVIAAIDAADDSPGL